MTKKPSSERVGRPTKYTSLLANEICEAIACSSYGIKRLCRANPHWPNPDTIFQWLRTYKEFSDQYAQAKRQQVEVLVEEILEIADDTSDNSLAAINAARLQIDTRKWIASKLVPRLYGDKGYSAEVSRSNQPKLMVDSDVKARLIEKLSRLASGRIDAECGEKRGETKLP